MAAASVGGKRQRDLTPNPLNRALRPAALWSRAAVMQLIEREYGVVLHVRSVGKYMARWGFTPQKPIRRAYEQSPVAVQGWLDPPYP